MTKLAVLIPIYHGDKLEFIQESINSVEHFLHTIGDIIIVADGPLELAVVSYLNSKDLLFLQLQSNRGLPVALNHGIHFALSEGYDFIARMDADDIVINDRFRKQLELLISEPEVDFCSSNAEFIDSDGMYLKASNFPSQISVSSLLSKCSIVHPSVMFRSSFFSKFGFYDESLRKSQDLDLWLKSISSGAKYCLIKEPLIKFRYDDTLVLRRIEEQDLNILIKRKYITNLFQYRFLIKNYIVKYMPKAVLSFIIGQSK